MTTIECSLNKEVPYFVYNGKQFDYSLAVERDIKLILQEANKSHPGVLENIYKKETLSPSRVRIYLDNASSPVAIMIIYTIEYKDALCKRTACGDYYLFYQEINTILPHPYQASICW